MTVFSKHEHNCRLILSLCLFLLSSNNLSETVNPNRLIPELSHHSQEDRGRASQAQSRQRKFTFNQVIKVHVCWCKTSQENKPTDRQTTSFNDFSIEANISSDLMT